MTCVCLQVWSYYVKDVSVKYIANTCLLSSIHIGHRVCTMWIYLMAHPMCTHISIGACHLHLLYMKTMSYYIKVPDIGSLRLRNLCSHNYMYNSCGLSQSPIGFLRSRMFDFCTIITVQPRGTRTSFNLWNNGCDPCARGSAAGINKPLLALRFICSKPILAMAWCFAVQCILLCVLTACVLGSHFRGAIFMARPSPSGGENEVSVIFYLSKFLQVILIRCLKCVELQCTNTSLRMHARAVQINCARNQNSSRVKLGWPAVSRRLISNPR